MAKEDSSNYVLHLLISSLVTFLNLFKQEYLFSHLEMCFFCFVSCSAPQERIKVVGLIVLIIYTVQSDG